MEFAEVVGGDVGGLTRGLVGRPVGGAVGGLDSGDVGGLVVGVGLNGGLVGSRCIVELQLLYCCRYSGSSRRAPFTHEVLGGGLG
jgi:hypothetical protein